MLTLTRRYRRNYAGEEIISERSFEGGQWNTTSEYVPNNIVNNQISNRAVVFGNGNSRKTLDPRYITTRRSGLLGADTLQTYACNAFYRDHLCDFLIVTHADMAREVHDSGFADNNIVYTRAHINLMFPKKFYLIPHDPYADAGTTALYLACFDGHKRVYMLGFDGHDSPGINNNIYASTACYDYIQSDMDDKKLIENQLTVFNTYPDVDFVWVTPVGSSELPEAWKYCLNVRQIPYARMIAEADL
jgi:hypothetical protein